MDQPTIDRYQAGGDLYQQYAALYGTTGANAIASAALSGDRGQITDAIAQAKYGAPLDTSTADAFVSNIVDNPLGAPTNWLNTLFGNTFLSFLKSPWVMLVVFCILFVAFGGPDYIRRKIKNA